MRRPANLVRGATVAVGIIYSGVLAVAGFKFDTTAKLLLGLLPTLATVLVVVWDLFAWKWTLLQRSTGRPWIGGLWTIELQPTPESHIPEGGNRGPIQAYAVVTQSFWSVHVEQYTAESKSSSKSFFWQRSGSGFDDLAFTYQNDPRPEVSARSGIHYGTCTFHLVGLRPVRCTGYYFTDRYTKGGMELALVDRRTDVGSFSDAAARQAAVPPCRRAAVVSVLKKHSRVRHQDPAKERSHPQFAARGGPMSPDADSVRAAPILDASAARRAAARVQRHGGLANAGGLAARYGLTRQAIQQHAVRETFPPARTHAGGPLYLVAEVDAWMRSRRTRVTSTVVDG